LLRNTYELDENNVMILISSWLKDKAQPWFHSKLELLQMNVDKILQQNEKLCTIVVLIEWIYVKNLRCDRGKQIKVFITIIHDYYYHDKIIKANRVPIKKKLSDYVIDGIPDFR